MAQKRRWMESALKETGKPLPQMPWQRRKVAVILPRLTGLDARRASITA